MTNKIDSLTDEQAIQAVRLFIELSGSEVWVNGEKPTPARMKQIADTMVSNAPDDVRAEVTAIVQGDKNEGTATQAMVARTILDLLSTNPSLAPVVQKAADSACAPHKFGIDPFSGAFVLALLLFTGDYKIGNKQFNPGKNMKDILHELPGVIKALPAGIWSALKGR